MLNTVPQSCSLSWPTLTRSHLEVISPGNGPNKPKSHGLRAQYLVPKKATLTPFLMERGESFTWRFTKVKISLSFLQAERAMRLWRANNSVLTVTFAPKGFDLKSAVPGLPGSARMGIFCIFVPWAVMLGHSWGWLIGWHWKLLKRASWRVQARENEKWEQNLTGTLALLVASFPILFFVLIFHFPFPRSTF